MNRSESLELWRRVAAGDLERPQEDPVDLHEWIRQVAEKIVAADEALLELRDAEIVLAAGLTGKLDEQLELRRYLQVIDAFPFVGSDGKERPPVRGERMKNLVEQAALSELAKRLELSPLELRKRIERMLGSDRQK